MSVWVYSRTRGQRSGGNGRERSAVSHGCELLLLLLQKISPLVSPAPRPHILPPLFQCFRSKLPVTASKGAGRAAAKTFKEPVSPSYYRPCPPSRDDRWYGLPRAARSLTVAGSGKRGSLARSPGTRTVRSSLSLPGRRRETPPASSTGAPVAAVELARMAHI